MKKPKAIVMITLDCVRPDHLGAYGYKGVETPFMDQIAREGVVCENTIAQAPNTWVSHASIFTGCNPYRHGIRTYYTVLSPEIGTLAEGLQQAGYATGAYPAHTLVGPQRGFDRGFNLFDLNPDDFLHSSAAGEHQFYRNWGTMWAKAKQWMSAQSQPYFIWLHYMGTHWEPIESLSLPEEYQQKFSPLGQYFDGKISWADKECIGKVVEYLQDEGIWDDSVFVVLSDHGDDLPANDPPYVWGGHNQNLFDNVMKIALMIRAPGFIPPSTWLESQVSSIDIMPTLLDIAGASIPESVEGVSLLAYCRDFEEDTKLNLANPAYMENIPRHWVGMRTPRWKLIVTDQPEPQSENKNRPPADTLQVLKAGIKSAVDTIQTNKSQINPILYFPFQLISRGLRWLKRLLSKNEPAPEQPIQRRRPELTPLAKGELDNVRVFALFDLESDPDEQQNVADQYPEIVARLKTQLVNLITQTPAAELENLTNSEQADVERHLKALGYL